MIADAPNTDAAARRLVWRLRWTRFVVRLVGGLSFLMGGGLVAVAVFVVPDRPVPANPMSGWVTATFALDAIIGLGLLVPWEIARRVGGPWLLAVGLLIGAETAVMLATVDSVAHPSFRSFMMGGVWLSALSLLFAAVLLRTRAAFVCRYLRTARATPANVLDALYQAERDPSARMRRFALRELRQTSVDAADRYDTKGG